MSNQVVDLTGQRFDRLSVIRYEGKSNYLCRCDCGKNKIIATSSLKNGLTKSCGCLSSEVHTKHGFNKLSGKDRFYRIWGAMKSRATNPNNTYARNYSQRGINICDEWTDFINFKNDMYKSYQEHLEKYGELNTTIDRIDNEIGYSLKNCKWASRKEQSRNMRTNKIVEFMGESHCLSVWAETTEINGKMLSYRINAGWNIERALTTPINKRLGRSALK